MVLKVKNSQFSFSITTYALCTGGVWHQSIAGHSLDVPNHCPRPECIWNEIDKIEEIGKKNVEKRKKEIFFQTPLFPPVKSWKMKGLLGINYRQHLADEEDYADAIPVD